MIFYILPKIGFIGKVKYNYYKKQVQEDGSVSNFIQQHADYSKYQISQKMIANYGQAVIYKGTIQNHKFEWFSWSSYLN